MAHGAWGTPGLGWDTANTAKGGTQPTQLKEGTHTVWDTQSL